MIQPIVEGHGDVEAVPVLIRRLSVEAGAAGIHVGKPIRRHRSELTRQAPFERTIELARRQDGCRAILIVLDSDDDCPRELAPVLQAWAAGPAAGLPCRVAIAHREFEAWFLAAIESLRGRRRIRQDAEYFGDPEAIRGAKGEIERLMVAGNSYHETADQPALAAVFDLASAHRLSRSFRHLVKAFGELVAGTGVALGQWPPDAWG
jgi:hypothetical protein